MIRKALWHLFRWPSVVLIDHDGRENARLVRTLPSGRPCAVRMGPFFWPVRVVTLNQNGTCDGALYCERWVDASWCPRSTFMVSK